MPSAAPSVSGSPVLAIVGPTASGKTAAALALAARFPVEIVSVDSALVYRGMDIGTAKPTAAERAAAPHHLIDIRDPLQAYSAAEFAADAGALIDAVRARGRMPLLVGGTMLYLKALTDGLAAMPAANPAVRAALEAEAAALGWPALHARLAQVDPATAARLAPLDGQRIARALEVWTVSGRTLTDWHASKNGAPSPDSARTTRMISLEPADRAWLHERIARRFDAMLAEGFVGEVQALRARGDLHADLPAMRCVGYRQAWQALDGEMPMAELRDRGVFATRQLARRQLTWLRGLDHRQVVAADAPDALEQVLRLAEGVAA